MARFFSARFYFVAGVVGVFFLPASAVRAIDIGGDYYTVQAAAADDTPLINMSIRRPGATNPITGTVTTVEIDDWGNIDFVTKPSINIQAYFDTGASGILLSKETADSFGIGVTGTTFTDVGVGGSEQFDVSEPLYASLGPVYQDAPTEGTGSHPQSVTAPDGGPLRMQIAQTKVDLSLGETPLDVIGMPAMAGKVVVIDPKPLNNTLINVLNGGDVESIEGLRTYVYDPKTTTPAVPTRQIDPGIPLTQHHIALSYGDMSSYTKVDPVGAAGPTLHSNPFIGPNPVTHDASDTTPGITVKYTDPVTRTSYSHTGSFLFDTGSQGSVISTAMAAWLHIRYTPGTENTADATLETFDPLHPSLPGTQLSPESQFATPMAGIGENQPMMAGFYLDWLMLPTTEAAHPLDPNDPMNIKFLQAPVFVDDISVQGYDGASDLTLDGVFGMNFLMASMSLDMSAIGFSPFDWIVFDEPGKTLGLSIAGETVPEPSALVLLAIGAAMFLLRRYAGRRR